MKYLLLFLSTLGLSLLLSTSFAGSLSSMNKAQANKALTDKTITTISAVTLDGKVIADNFTGYFGKDGKMQGKLAKKPSYDPQTDQGTWKVKSNGVICLTWDHWNKAKETCVTFYKLSNAILIINSDKGFESLILDDNVQPGNQM